MSAPAVRWPVSVVVGAYAVLALLTVFTGAAHGPVAFELGLCALLAVCLLGVIGPRASSVLVGVLIVLIGILVIESPWFGFFLPVAYVAVFRVLRWPWQAVGVVATGMVAGTAQSYGVDKSTTAGLVIYGAVVVVNVIPMTLYAWLARRAERHHTERDLALAEVREANRKLAESMTENAALQEQLLVRAREAGVQDERGRMAREIHDTLAQGLTGIISQLRAADTVGADGWRRHVAAADKLARESLTEARRSVHALRPEPLRTARLSEALAGVAERWSALHEIPVQVATTGTVRPLSPEAETALLRIAQEALANVAKHARASRVGVTLSFLEQEAALDVRDDGAGFDPARTDGSGFGLTTMRQRVTGLSGSLQIESEPGGGTGISARVPVVCT